MSGRGTVAFRLLQDLAPDGFGAAENLGNELPHLVRGCARGHLARFALRHNLFCHVDHGAGIETEKVRDDGDHHPANAQTTPDAHAAPVRDIAAWLLVA